MKIFIMIMSLILTISCSDFNIKEIKCETSKDCPIGYTICNKESENSKGYCSTKCDSTGNDCAEFETTKQCNPQTNECVECLTDSNCYSENKCVENQCKAVCRNNSDCGNYVCKNENDEEVGYCLTSCTENSDCNSEYYCNTGDDKNKCESCNFCDVNHPNCLYNPIKQKKACCEKGSDSFNDHQCYLLCVDSYYSEGKGICVDDCENNEVRDDNILACFCKDGFGGQNCKDINECEAETHTCETGFECENTIGSFVCNDVDECDLNLDDCETGFECENTIGSFECNNINECDSDIDICDKNAICLDTEGSFTCTCIEGFSGDGQNCQDINECDSLISLCGENEDCINGDGNYNCVCKNGYELNGNECVDINECLNPYICPQCLTDCDNPQRCENKEGSFVCKSSCDVCENGTCVQTSGVISCRCDEGFQHIENNDVCIRIQTCETYECDPIQNQVCVDTNGTAQCVCKTGFYPNPLNNSPACILEENCELECPSEYSCMLNNGAFYCCKEVMDILECVVK